jgi:crotonobetainyl-CoA:carnitine CoA-transferase CaiB-like acyl-CoA transferase
MTTGLAEGPLSDLVVVDVSEGVAGGHASRLLADLGARVLKVEPPGGDRLRRLGPFGPGGADGERGGLQLALGAGKESLVLDLDDAEGRRRLRELVAGAEIFLESAEPGVMAGRGLDYATLAADLPRLVYASHTPFGQDGPYAGRRSSEIVDYAMGGYMYFCGEPGRPPLMVPGFQGELHAGMQLALGALIALRHSRRTGAGQHVDVSTLESLLSAHCWLTTLWTHKGVVQERTGSALIRCADGFVYWMAPRPAMDLFVLIERFELLDDPRWVAASQDGLVWREAVPELRAMFEEWAQHHPKQEVYERAQTLRLNVTPANDAADLDRSPGLRERGFWREVEHPLAGTLELPGSPWEFSGARVGPRRGSPLLDAAAGATVEGRAWPAPPHPELADTLPFAGLRVLDVTSNWSGPVAARHLGDLGADVVKVETARRPAARDNHPPHSEWWNDWYNRAGSFNLLNRSKRAIGLDLSRPEGRETLLRLVEQADVLIENYAARVMPNLGLTYEVIAERNPSIVMCSMPGFGQRGPETNYTAYGSNIEASSGLVATTGYGPGELQATSSFYADPITGGLGLIGTLAALIARERGAGGQYVVTTLLDSGVLFSVDSLMEHRLTGVAPGPQSNRSPRRAPQGAYRSAGPDDWLALAVEDEEQWRALCQAIGRPELAERYPTLEDRQRAHDEIDEAIAAWSAPLDHQEATQLLQQAGVPAGPVLANWEILSDPHLFARNYFARYVHPKVGAYDWDGVPWKLSRTPARPFAPPLFAADNDAVLAEYIGASAEEVAALRAAGALEDVPTMSAPTWS